MSLFELLVAVFLIVLTASYVAVLWISPQAQRWNHVAHPNERSSHPAPIPYGGGLVVVAIGAVAWLVFIRVHPGLRWDHALSFAAGGLLIACISFIDDFGHVPYTVRLAVHILAGLCFVVGWGTWNHVELPIIGMVTLGIFALPTALLWIVGVTNSFNFIDGIDGLAAGQAVGAGLGWTLLGAMMHHPPIAVAGMVLAASSLGFLIHNWQPATIFLGDVGSTFLGYSFSTLAVVSALYDPRLALCGVLLVWPAVFDSAFTVFRRLYNGQSIFVGHRTFLFHRLVDAGWSHAATASLYIPLSLLGAILAATWQVGSRFVHTLIGLALVVLCLSLWLLVHLEEQRMKSTR
ncbi:MAG: MraY family glycosyltransferase [Chloroflexota bacterium]